MSELINIPSTIDNPPYILRWSVDEAAPPLIGLCVGIMMGKALICTVIGLMLTKVYRKYRDGNPDGFFMHALYNYGLDVSGSRVMINPYIKRLLP